MSKSTNAGKQKSKKKSKLVSRTKKTRCTFTPEILDMLVANGYSVLAPYKRESNLAVVQEGASLKTIRIRESNPVKLSEGSSKLSHKVTLLGADITIIDTGSRIYMARKEDFPDAKSLRFGIDSAKNNDKVKLLGERKQ